jgi:YggT family protein
MIEPFGPLAQQWQQIVWVVAVLSMIVGAFAAIWQTNIKRLMAYSSIGHVGYALIGLVAGGKAGISAVALYMAIYLFMNVAAFVLQVLAQTLGIYLLVLLVRVLLSWFPNLDWSNPLLSGVSAITDPFLNAFRGLIPPVGGLDLSSLVAFIALQLAQSLLGASIATLSGGLPY